MQVCAGARGRAWRRTPHSQSFLGEGDADGADEQAQPLAKAKQRLEQLEAAARGVATVEMSQAEYVKRIERLHRGLQSAWDNNHRVAALKICIQVRDLVASRRHATCAALCRSLPRARSAPRCWASTVCPSSTRQCSSW